MSIDVDEFSRQDEAYAEFEAAVKKFLNERGWDMQKTGGIRATRIPDARSGGGAFEFQLEVEFTGAPYDAIGGPRSRMKRVK